MSIGVKFFGGGALLLILFLGVGFALPGSWSVERDHLIPATAQEVFPYLNGPGGWEAWVPWPEAGARFDGPSEGPGATRIWDDPEWGDGVFTITAQDPPRSVNYRVEVEEGSMTTMGLLTLTPEAGGTRLTWREEGDFGWNPLMGWVARFMDRLQGRELERSLLRLDSVVTGRPIEPPTEEGETGG